MALPDDGKRYEIIDGELLVTPALTWDHQSVAGWLFRRLADERPEILADELVWQPDPAHEPLRLDLQAFFARALGE